ncbi:MULTISPECIES: sugar-binding transcriptional regulator [Vibrio]|uniref:Sugar-binding transcriptional regulator n=1 Tax=Vibrio mediterranei TaxID=689 RepID=A0A3G4VHM2_9VIBR|nr:MULTISPECIES: sugar-binding transcriptional regulator [Vibrio]AYV24326.1 sugar-binding transcriptional regulator [Vibrio mediterranei]EDL54531.1 transcriptional regulator [Vibrio mediterranei AK1]MDA0106598.1 sugar-binding transcriptional regulator [Vibrio sp. La 4.2.2]NOH28413.1 sugar-binding transcriptional regulator [Vibrio mediterranei]NUW74724.1 sugar-binding transcriptional regulator [Vibrio mediterranei]
MKSEISETGNDLLTEIAVAYYQDGATQEEISKKFGVSRAKIGRLLKQARDEGIVEITVKYHPVYSAKIEQRLIERFGVKRALIALDQADEEAQRMQVGGLVSNYLAQTLKGGTVVTVGQGRNVSAVAHHMGVITPRDCKFVCGIGGIHPRGGRFNADHICRQLAKKYGGSSETLYAPAYAENKDQKLAFMQNATVKQTLDLARKADMAIVGVGDMSENSYMVDLGWFTADEVVQSRLNQGVVGDFAGYDFFDIQGQAANTVMSDRVIGLGLEEFRMISEVIAIASENSKPMALLGALRTGVIDVVATSVSNALTVLNLDEQMKNLPS